MSKRSNLTLDDGMMVWKAREAYRVQSVLLAVFYCPQFILGLLAVSYLSRGLWGTALVMLLAIAGLWGVRWGLCTALPWALRWGWHQMRVGVATLQRKGHP